VALVVRRKRRLYHGAVKLLFYGLVVSAHALLAGCGLLLSQPGPLTTLDAPHSIELTEVPFFSQGDDLCGPASISMLLVYRGFDTSPAKLEPLIYIPGRKGSLQAEMLAVTRRLDFIPYVIEPKLEDLVLELGAGNPVLVLQNLGFGWLPKWHYAVVIGYNLDRDIVVLRSGNKDRLEMPSTLFMRHWRDSGYWAMVALPAAQLPKTARELPWLESVASLERLQRWETVNKAYDTAIVRWPQSFYAHLGAGNARYHLHQLKSASAYYLQAAHIRPDSAVAHNNLAQTLFELGRYTEAHAHAVRAVALGGSDADTYRQTLQQIEAVRNR